MDVSGAKNHCGAPSGPQTNLVWNAMSSCCTTFTAQSDSCGWQQRSVTVLADARRLLRQRVAARAAADCFSLCMLYTRKMHRARFLFPGPEQLTTLERIKHGEGFSLPTTTQTETNIDGACIGRSRKASSWASACWLFGTINRRIRIIGGGQSAL